MTIDEAILQVRELVNERRYKAETFDDELLKRFLTSKENEEELAKEHEQLEKLLEELKNVYNKAVDDFAEWVIYYVDDYYFSYKDELLEGWKKHLNNNNNF